MENQMSFKMHFVHSQLIFFQIDLATKNEEYGKRIHQNIYQMKQGTKASSIQTWHVPPTCSNNGRPTQYTSTRASILNISEEKVDILYLISFQYKNLFLV